jgi:hypothetical protein
VVADARQTAKECAGQFLQVTLFRMLMVSKIKTTLKALYNIKDKFSFQVIKQQGKIRYVEELWNAELEQMTKEAFKDKSKAGKKLQLQLTGIEPEVQAFAIRQYIQRCKFLYVLAFF